MPYVECDPKGLDPHPERCSQAGVKAYPTWTIGGSRFESVMTLEEIAKASGFSFKQSGSTP